MSMSESYVGLYVGPLRQMCGQLSESELRVYVALSTYVDPLATCWPGINELHEVTGVRHEDVMAALESLSERGLVVFLRRGEWDNLTRRMLPNIYALTPDLVYIRPELRGEVAARLENTRPQASLSEGMIPKTPLIPESNQKPEPATEPAPSNQRQNHHHQPAPASSNGKRLPPAAAGAAAHEGNDPTASGETETGDELKSSVTNTNANTRSQQREAQTPPPGSAPPPSRDYTKPLPTPLREQLAGRVQSEAGPTTIVQARELVDKFGPDLVERGLVMLGAVLSKDTAIRSPMGLLTSWLRRGKIQADDQALARRMQQRRSHNAMFES